MLDRLLVAFLVLTASIGTAQPVSIVILGDMPYGPPEEVYPLMKG